MCQYSLSFVSHCHSQHLPLAAVQLQFDQFLLRSVTGHTGWAKKMRHQVYFEIFVLYMLISTILSSAHHAVNLAWSKLPPNPLHSKMLLFLVHLVCMNSTTRFTWWNITTFWTNLYVRRTPFTFRILLFIVCLQRCAQEMCSLFSSKD